MGKHQDLVGGEDAADYSKTVGRKMLAPDLIGTLFLRTGDLGFFCIVQKIVF